MHCPSCGFSLRERDNFCSNCGVRQNRDPAEASSSTIPCKACGTLLPPGSNFCGFCGVVDPHTAPADGEATWGEAPAEEATPAHDTKALDADLGLRFGPKRPIGLASRPSGGEAAKAPEPVLPAAEPVRGAPTELLDEIGFLQAQGLVAEARQALAELEAKHPSHPVVAAHREKLRATPRPKAVGDFSLGDLGDEEIDAALEDFGADTGQQAKRKLELELEPSAPVAVVEAIDSGELLEVEPEFEPETTPNNAAVGPDGDGPIEITVESIIPDFDDPDSIEEPVDEPATIPAPPRIDFDLPPEPSFGRPRRKTVVPDDPTRPPTPKPYGNASPPMGQAARARLEDVDPLLDLDVDVDDDLQMTSSDAIEVDLDDSLLDLEPDIDLEGARTRRPEVAPFDASRGPAEAVMLELIGPRGEVLVRRLIGPGETFDVGRDSEPPWGDDDHMQPLHAELLTAPGGVMVSDRFEGGGPVFRLLTRPEMIRDADEFRVGQSLVVYERGTMGLGRLRVQINGRGPIDTVEISPSGVMMGRERGHVVFPEDTYVSGEHCRIVCNSQQVYIEDLGSSNGTYVRVRPNEPVTFGSLLLIGQTQMRVERASNRSTRTG